MAVSEFVQEYQETGFTALRSVFSMDEIGLFRAEAERLRSNPKMTDENNLRAVVRQTISGGRIVDRLDPIVDISEVFAKLVADERIHAPLRAILGERAFLLKDKLIFKSPGAHGYNVHQDYSVWQELPAPGEAMVSVLISIDSSNAENGAVAFYAGMHHEHYAGGDALSGIFNPNSGLVPAEVLVGREPRLLELEPGDVVLFSSLTPHQSGPNRSPAYRRSLYLTYSSSRYGDLYKNYYEHFHRYLVKDRKADDKQEFFFL